MRKTVAVKRRLAATIISAEGEAMMNVFQKAAPLNRRPEALEEFRINIDTAIATAEYFHVDKRDIANMLEGQAERLRLRHATTSAIG